MNQRIRLADTNSVVDRISNLPDSIPCQILSLLPTKHAVGTSILSTRWRFLWTSITNLDLDVDDEMGNLAFVLFVYRVLVLLNRPSLQKFRLKCRLVLMRERRHVHTWVCIFSEDQIELPHSLSGCTSLVVLKLSGEIVFNPPACSVCFPSLKVLHLVSVTYVNDESVRKLFPSCPVLEDLVIERRHRFDNVYTYHICAPALKCLRLDFIIDYPEDDDYNDIDGMNTRALQINAPSLQYLDLIDYVSGDFSIENLSSIVKANVDVNVPDLYEADEDFGLLVFKLLEGLTNVKLLSLSGHVMTAFYWGRESETPVPVFHNLTRLAVDFRCGN